MSIALVLSILTCMAAAVFSLRGGMANQPEARRSDVASVAPGTASVRGRRSMGLGTFAIALVISILLAGVLFKATRICDNWTNKR
jgi:hypothetical protein